MGLDYLSLLEYLYIGLVGPDQELQVQADGGVAPQDALQLLGPLSQLHHLLALRSRLHLLLRGVDRRPLVHVHALTLTVRHEKAVALSVDNINKQKNKISILKKMV